MRIAVFGATGMAGSAIVSEALTRGHHVVAASRRPATANANEEHLAVRTVDVADPDAVDAVLADADAAVLTIRLAPGEEDRLAPLTRGVLDAAAHHDTRLLIVGGSAPLRSLSRPDRLLIDDPDHVPEAWKSIAQASLDQFHTCQEHPYAGYVYLSPPAVFEPGERSGSYRRGTTTLLTDANGASRITPPDFALAVLDELEQPGCDRHFTVAHGPAS
ncbi:MAG: NAD(P)H-binding protein [Brevibacterium sp.]|nr:NAD(P)H-binding protein [Brevibacterium sp.]